MMNENWYALRWKVLNRDCFTCQYCGQTAPDIMLQVDHLTALANGGTDDPKNLITACTACNVGKNLTPLRIPAQRISSRRNKPSGLPIWQALMGYLKVHHSATATEMSKALNLNRPNISHVLTTDKVHFEFSHQDKRDIRYKLAGK